MSDEQVFQKDEALSRIYSIKKHKIFVVSLYFSNIIIVTMEFDPETFLKTLSKEIVHK